MSQRRDAPKLSVIGGDGHGVNATEESYGLSSDHDALVSFATFQNQVNVLMVRSQVPAKQDRVSFQLREAYPSMDYTRCRLFRFRLYCLQSSLERQQDG